MSLKATSHGDLQIICSSAKSPVQDSRMLYKSFSLSSHNTNGQTTRLLTGKEGHDEKARELQAFSPLESGIISRRGKPIHMVRPVSAMSPGASFIKISQLQGELVRKRKECEDFKQQNKYLSNEIHMERVMMRTESELTMRNLRHLNQDLLAQVKELKQKVHMSQQRATLCCRVAEEADSSRCEAERRRAQAETQAQQSREEKSLLVAENGKLKEEIQQLKSRLTDVQQVLAHAEKNYFESKIKLDRITVEKQVLLEENRDLEREGNKLRHKLKELTEESTKLKEKEVSSRRRALAAEELSEKAMKAQCEVEQEKRLAEHERQEKAKESDTWRRKHDALADILRSQEDEKSKRQNKACQANIKSYFLCVTENDQRVRILKNEDGTPRSFLEGEPVYLSTPGTQTEEPERLMYRVAAPSSSTRRNSSQVHFSELSPIESPEMVSPQKSRKVVEYFWLPTDEE
ncbi:myosin heavy chain, skeletal muscle, adult [Acipenser oxyrinchus oxyrinchus]|uniref:Myosin heavy chain, skeletal muscle, adult n=1 Tax=Acipenser oxyrinchus oxyrinchus TaxID=40147 RepID=A0AAD8G3H7_ACIOX|nr:myosin heavy chain, skeletal muscle, adult [Acipenser oxyrinchus oxyrinchus]